MLASERNGAQQKLVGIIVEHRSYRLLFFWRWCNRVLESSSLGLGHFEPAIVAVRRGGVFERNGVRRCGSHRVALICSVQRWVVLMKF